MITHVFKQKQCIFSTLGHVDPIVFGSHLFFKKENYLRVYGDAGVVVVVKTSVVVDTVVGSDVAVDDEEVEHLFLLPW
jgi:hypothetical protein